MRRMTILACAVVMLLAFSATETRAIDFSDAIYSILNGINNNWMRDDDGDGIPNCLDDTYEPPEDGDGTQFRGGRTDGVSSTNGSQWQRDDDGDGIPNGEDDDWVPPEDCSGYGHQGGLK